MIAGPEEVRRPAVLITGAAGFVGRRLVERLRSLDTEFGDIFAAIRLGERASNGPAVVLDVTDRATIVTAVSQVRPDIVVHLAAQASVGEGASSSADTWETNVVGVVNLARAIADITPQASVLFASTAEVYGSSFNAGAASETTAAQPLSVYGKTKLAAELAFSDLLAPGNTLIVARPTNHSGRGQDDRFVLPSFASQIRSGTPELRVGNLTPRRDFLHVLDVVEAYVELLRRRTELASRSVFNIGSGRTVAISELLERMIRLTSASPEIVADPARMRASEVPVAAVDVTAIHHATGWRAQRTLDNMLSELLGLGEG